MFSKSKVKRFKDEGKNFIRVERARDKHLDRML